MNKKQKIGIAAVAVIGVVAVAVIVYTVVSMNKNEEETSSTPGASTTTGTITGTTTTITVTNTTTDQEQIHYFAKALYDDMQGTKASGRNTSMYDNFLKSSDTVFRGTAEYFYKTYGNGSTLYQWLDGEWFFSSKDRALKEAIMDRLKK